MQFVSFLLCKMLHYQCKKSNCEKDNTKSERKLNKSTGIGVYRRYNTMPIMCYHRSEQQEV